MAEVMRPPGRAVGRQRWPTNLLSYLMLRSLKDWTAQWAVPSSQCRVISSLVLMQQIICFYPLVAFREIAAAGVDALIVQDLGAVELIRRVAPGLPIHGSTQMSITSAQGAQASKNARENKSGHCFGPSKEQ
eukprot:1154973-Pelagomonas_calceolata.AAC.6